jgi:pre-rRNA-processing protein TSR4
VRAGCCAPCHHLLPTQTWLDPTCVPSIVNLLCPCCKDPLRLLVQIYAPLDSVEDSSLPAASRESPLLQEPSRAFHRMISVFCCAKAGCVARGGVTVLRCQLNRASPVLPFARSAVLPTPDPERVCPKCCMPRLPGATTGCVVCDTGRASTWVEWDVLLGDDDDADGERDEEDMGLDDEHVVARVDSMRMSEPQVSASASSAAPAETDEEEIDTVDDDDDLMDLDQGQLVEAIGGTPEMARLTKQLAEDDCFGLFEVTVQRSPKQVLRYCRWDDEAPLWISDAHRPDGSPSPPFATSIPSSGLCVGPLGHSPAAAGLSCPPPCERCGCSRRFELQVMPQLVHFLVPPGADTAHEEELDFGVIAVYTCTGACATRSQDPPGEWGHYAVEFAWVQSDAK